MAARFEHPRGVFEKEFLLRGELADVDFGDAPANLRIATECAGAGAGRVDEDAIEIAASITDQGGGIGKIEWRVNGLTLGVETRGFDRLAVDAQVAEGGATAVPVTLTQTLSLDPGENLIEVVAYNEKGLSASDPASVTVSNSSPDAGTASW